MLIETLKSNVKNGSDAVDLGPVVLVVGDNATGKTGFVESVKIGLTAKSKLGAVPSQMMKLAKNGADKLQVSLGLRNGSGTVIQTTVSVEGSTTKASKPVRDCPVSAVVLDRVITDIMSKEVKRQREAFLRLIAPRDILKAARVSVPTTYQPRWDALVETVRKDQPDAAEADIIVAVSELIREKTREARAVAKQDSAAPTGARPSADAIKALQAEVAVAQAYADASRKREAAASRRQVLIDDLARLQPTIPADASGLTMEQIKNALKLLGSADEVNAFILGLGASTCPCCMSSVNSESLQAAAAKIKERRSGLVAEMANAEQRVPYEVLAKQKELAEVDAVLAAPMPQAPTRSIGESQGELSVLLASEQAWAGWEVAHKAAVEAEADATAFAAIGKTADRVVTEILQGAVKAFEDAASVSLPSGWRFKLKLYDGKKAVCEPGLVIDGVFRWWDVLSGAQQTACLVGLADAWAQREQADCKVVIIDDVWIRETMLHDLLEGLTKIVGKTGGLTQAFVCAASIKDVKPVVGCSLVMLDKAPEVKS